jgi:hypothetical protein
MATNPDGGLFPGLAAEPFVLAPEVASLAVTVMRLWEEFGDLRRAVSDGVLEIAYVFETKPFDPEKEEFKPHTIARVTKASPLWLSLTGHDLVIQFRKAFWDAFSDHQRQAVLHHELMHIEWSGGKLSLRPHDVEEMSKTARRYGPALPGRRELFNAFSAWQRDQAGENVVPLRAVDGESFMDRVMDKVVDEVNAGALDGNGTTVTASRIRGRRSPAEITVTAAEQDVLRAAAANLRGGRRVDPETGEILDPEDDGQGGEA